MSGTRTGVSAADTSEQEARPVALHPEFQSAFRLRAVRKTRVTLSGFDVSELTEARSTVTLQGTAENLPTGTPCRLRWIVHSEGRGTHRVLLPEPHELQVDGDALSVSLEVDAFALGLFGRGTLAIEIQPDFPLCAPARLEDAKGIAFENVVEVKFGDGLEGLKVGALRQLELTTTGLLEGCEALLTLHESGDPKSDRLQQKFHWGSDDRTAKGWRVGCTATSEGVVFGYEGPIEYGYTLEVKPRGAAEYVPITTVAKLATVPRPKLSGLELSTSQGVDRGAYRWHTAFTFAWNEKRDVRYVLKGRLTGCEPGLPVPFKMGLFATESAGGEPRWFHPETTSKSLVVNGDGSFEVDLADFTRMDPDDVEDLTQQSADWLFAAAIHSPAASGGRLTDVFDVEGAPPLTQGLARDQWAGAVMVELEHPIELGERPANAYEVPPEQLEFHTHDFFAGEEGGVRWRLCSRGIEIEGEGVPRTTGSPTTAKNAWERYHVEINAIARDFGVPVEIIMATICAESGGGPEESKLVREERSHGYTSDADTPHKVSVGLMHTLLSTARERLVQGGLVDDANEIDRQWLLDPYNGIQAGTAVIAYHAEHAAKRRAEGEDPVRVGTKLDPPLVAIAYNAGSFRPATNRWKLVQTARDPGVHADWWVKYFNDFWAVLASHEVDAEPTLSIFAALDNEDATYDFLKRAYETARTTYGAADDAETAFAEGDGQVTLIGGRGFKNREPVSTNTNNTWDDTLFVVWKSGEEKHVREFVYSSEYKEDLEGSTAKGGPALLCLGLHKYKLGFHHKSDPHASITNATEYVGSGKKYRCLDPFTGVRVTRDANWDLETGTSETVQESNASINIHYGGHNSAGPSNWSDGCQVIYTWSKYRDLIRLVETDATIKGSSNNELAPVPAADGTRPVIYCLLPGSALTGMPR